MVLQELFVSKKLLRLVNIVLVARRWRADNVFLISILIREGSVHLRHEFAQIVPSQLDFFVACNRAEHLRFRIQLLVLLLLRFMLFIFIGVPRYCDIGFVLNTMRSDITQSQAACSILVLVG